MNDDVGRMWKEATVGYIKVVPQQLIRVNE
jgi:hypothetical protein